MWYLEEIKRILGCTEEEALQVESYMRLESGTLSNLSPEKFRREARICFQCVRMDQKEAAALAKTY